MMSKKRHPKDRSERLELNRKYSLRREAPGLRHSRSKAEDKGYVGAIPETKIKEVVPTGDSKDLLGYD